ncbi:MAG: helix-turn-helix domain-containing protein [Leptospirales bacterium]
MRPDAVKKIRIALVEKGWNQVVLSKRLGISPTYLSMIMSGQRGGEHIRKKMAHILEIPFLLLSD